VAEHDWVQTGKNHFMMRFAAVAEGRTFTEIARQSSARGKSPVKAPVARAPLARKATAPVTKTLPPFPDDALTGLAPHQIERHARAAEFNALFDWLKAADAAAGHYSIRDEIFRDKVGERVDGLRRYVFA
jgi:hypothetical protein